MTLFLLNVLLLLSGTPISFWLSWASEVFFLLVFHLLTFLHCFLGDFSQLYTCNEFFTFLIFKSSYLSSEHSMFTLSCSYFVNVVSLLISLRTLLLFVFSFLGHIGGPCSVYFLLAFSFCLFWGLSFILESVLKWLVTLDLLVLFNWGAETWFSPTRWMRFFSWSLYCRVMWLSSSLQTPWTGQLQPPNKQPLNLWLHHLTLSTSPQTAPATWTSLDVPSMPLPQGLCTCCALALECLFLRYLNGLLAFSLPSSFFFFQMPPCPRGPPLASLSIPPSSVSFPYSTSTYRLWHTIYLFLCLLMPVFCL